MRVAQAAVRVSDLWFTIRSQALQTTADEVEEWLNRKKDSFPARRVETGAFYPRMDG